MIDTPDELLKFIDSCLKPKQKEKKEYGEVFTPMHVIFELLDQLDLHYSHKYERSIFTEKHFTWFDPASGMGNFQVAVYLRLMNGLKHQIPEDDERKRHILENMLYMCEINKKNVFVEHQIFNVNNQFKLNIYNGNTLEFNPIQEWNVTNFDVVMQNPPYNLGGIRSHTGTKLGEKNQTIWPTFVQKSIQEWVKPDGHLICIIPNSWLKQSHSTHNQMLQKHIINMTIWDNSQSKSVINSDIPISLIVMQNTENIEQVPTKITSVFKRRNLETTSVEYLDPVNSIPLAFHSIFNKLINFINENDLHLHYKTKTVKSFGTKLPIPKDFTEDDMLAVDTYTLKNGIMVKKTAVKHPDMSKRKLIISNKSSFSGAFIDDGKLGLTNWYR
jgi:hypothetical protein